MIIYNVATYLTERKRFNYQEHSIEGLDFNLIPLTDDMIQSFKVDNATYAHMLESAARQGVSIGRDRVCDDSEMAIELDEMWLLDQFDGCEPSLIHRVGEKVCDISGLTEYIEAQQLEEQTAPDDEGSIVDGDKPFNPDATLGNLGQANLERDSEDDAA